MIKKNGHHLRMFPYLFSQKGSVIGSNPMDWKKSSALSNITLGVQPRFFISSLTSMLGFSGYGLSISAMLFQDWAHMFPSKWAGIGPSGSTKALPYFSCNRWRTKACSCSYKGWKWLKIKIIIWCPGDANSQLCNSRS